MAAPAGWVAVAQPEVSRPFAELRAVVVPRLECLLPEFRELRVAGIDTITAPQGDT
ncbi:hypothetical protein [Guyparkeria sp.]|uniref:hypothetical protein n=1 Tax=Guyparkeria sp. TaxID=2035736 RepID=UPI00356168A1